TGPSGKRIGKNPVPSSESRPNTRRWRGEATFPSLFFPLSTSHPVGFSLPCLLIFTFDFWFAFDPPPALRSRLTAYWRLPTADCLPLDRRLLQGEAVQSAQAPHEVHGVDADHGPVGNQLGERAQRDAVLRIVEGRDQDGGVRDVEVRVARGQALAVKVQGRGHGQRDNLDPRAILEPHALESFPVLLEWPVVRIARIILSGEDHGARPDE